MIQSFLTEYFPLISYAIVRGLVLFAIALGVVYIFGRMLELVMTNRARNALALFTIVITSYYSTLIYDGEILIHEWEIWWRSLVYTSLGCIFFVIFGWDFYDRANAWLDKKFARDPNKRKRTK